MKKQDPDALEGSVPCGGEEVDKWESAVIDLYARTYILGQELKDLGEKLHAEARTLFDVVHERYRARVRA